MTALLASSRASFLGRALRGTFWTVLRYGAEYGLRLGSNLILTRLLFPEVFGLMALVNVLMTGLAMFSDIGIATSVVQSPRGDDPKFLRTAFSLQVLRGVVLFAGAVALAGWMAGFYSQPQLRLLIPVVGLTALVSGFNSMSLIRMQRHLELGRLAAIDLTTGVIGTVVMIVWAFLSPSVWALVYGGLVGSLLKLGVSHYFSRGESLGFAWDRESAGQLLHFGKWIFASTVLFFLSGQADRLIFGRLLDVAVLGVYGIAFMLATMPTQVLWSVGSFVLLPAFSRTAATHGGIEPSYRQLQLPVLLIGGLPVAMLIACGPELIALLYDSRYADAGWMLQILACGTWMQVPQTLSGNAIVALGVPRWMAVGNALKLVGIAIFLPIGFAALGAPGAIAGLAAAEAFRYATFAFAARGFGLPVLRADLLCSVLVLVLVAAGRLTIGALADAGSTTLVKLCSASGVIGLIWLGASAWALRREIPGLYERAREALSESPVGAVEEPRVS